MKTILCADLFCGGGGTSTGMIEAFKKAGIKYELVGVNHWQIAIDTNNINHKGRYYRDGVEKVSPRALVPGGRLNFLWASPECTNHSRAKGGRPKDEQSRATAWDVLKWPQELYIDRIYIENVSEFLDWGPCDTKGNPIQSRKGETFRAYIKCLESLGYKVEWQIMNAADFGAPTSRRRLIVQAVRGKEKILWPTPSHSANPKSELFGAKPYVSAAEIIDWSIKGKSIFDRKKPLADNTLKRIEAGIKKYWGVWAEPFLVILRGTHDSNIKASAKSINLPLPTITTSGMHAGLVQSFITRYNGGDDRNHGINEPLPVVDCSNRYGVVQSFMIPFFGERDNQKPRTRGIHDPLPTVTGQGAGALIQAFIMATGQTGGGDRTRRLNEPLSTVVTKAEHCIVEPLFIPQQSGGSVKPVGNPLSTIATEGAISKVDPFITSYYGNGTAESISEPLDTVTCKERFGLCSGRIFVDAKGNMFKLDILFRMFQPHELAAAMSFPADYKFAGNKGDIVKQIGNAVPPKLAKALINAAISA